MSDEARGSSYYPVARTRALAGIRRALSEFLAVPTAVIVVFIVLALLTYILDRSDFPTLRIIQITIGRTIFNDASSTESYLNTIATSVITATSITISIVLLSVQQSAGALTTQVIDQFLRRRSNQFTFGFFIGLSLYTLLILGTVGPTFNPVYGATLAFILTGVALYLLLLLLYTTINQTRPSVIIQAIHDDILAARKRQLPLLSRTRRSSEYKGKVSKVVRADDYGFVTNVDLDVLREALAKSKSEVEVVLLVSIGTFVAFRDELAEIRVEESGDLLDIEPAVHKAITLEDQRNLEIDPAYGIGQIWNIAWSSLSTAKSNPAPAILGVHSLRDVLARLSIDERPGKLEKGQPMPVVYTDSVRADLLDAIASLAVSASDSMQHEAFAEILRTFAVMLDRLSPDLQDRAENLIMRLLSALGDQVLSVELDSALGALVGALDRVGKPDAATAVRQARADLRLSVGRLGSRSTRVPATH